MAGSWKRLFREYLRQDGLQHVRDGVARESPVSFYLGAARNALDFGDALG